MHRSASTKILSDDELMMNASPVKRQNKGQRRSTTVQVIINAKRKIMMVMWIREQSEQHPTYLHAALLFPKFFHIVLFHLTLQKLL